MEWRRRDAHSRASDQGGRAAVRAYSAMTTACVATYSAAKMYCKQEESWANQAVSAMRGSV